VEDAIRVAIDLARVFAAPALRLPAAELTGEQLLDDLTGGEPLDAWGEAEPGGRVAEPEAAEPLDGVRLELAPEEALPAGGQPLTAEELRRLIEAGARPRAGKGGGGGRGGPRTELARGPPPAPPRELPP